MITFSTILNLTQTISETMARVPEPMFLLLLGFTMITLSVRFRGRSVPKPETESADRRIQAPSAEPLAKTVAA
jgi:hypothetical protein